MIFKDLMSSKYCPLPFILLKHLDDLEFKEFLKSYSEFEEQKKNGQDVKNIWIMKPG